MKKSCGDCTKCCEGFLSANIRGHSMGDLTEDIHKPKPCFFIEIGVGCKDYSNRPENPCRIFKCEWLNNKDIPEELKPSKSKNIALRQNVDGIEYLSLVQAGERLDSKVLSWYLLYAMSNGINFAWEIDYETRWIGSPQFIKSMKNKYSNHNH